MDLVIDANILFSVLIASEKAEEIIFNEDIHIFAPEFLFKEFEKYKKLIMEKAERNDEEFGIFLEIIKKKIRTVSNEETEKYLEEAKKICPDESDIDYFALSLKLKCPIWSNDKELKNQDKIKIYSTLDLVNEFGL